MLPSLGTGSHRLLLIAVVLLLAAAVGVSATGAPRPPKDTFTISGDVAGLYPGGQKTAILQITNYYPWTIEVRGISAVSTKTNKPGCSALMVTSPGWWGARRVNKASSVTIGVPVRMSPRAPDACQGAAFHLVYSGWGVRP